MAASELIIRSYGSSLFTDYSEGNRLVSFLRVFMSLTQNVAGCLRGFSQTVSWHWLKRKCSSKHLTWDCKVFTGTSVCLKLKYTSLTFSWQKDRPAIYKTVKKYTDLRSLHCCRNALLCWTVITGLMQQSSFTLFWFAQNTCSPLTPIEE